MKKTITILAITLSLTVFAQQNDTMFIHTTNQFIHEFATAEIDSIIFQRTQPPMALPRDTVWMTDTVIVGIFDLVLPNRCHLNIPRWGVSLGTVSFHTNQTWTIEGYGISQIWSDAVTATACQKTTFNSSSGSLDAIRFYAECRSNPDFPGDFFSWCAVVLFANKLCPYPWRVPTAEDFLDLATAFGQSDVSPQFIIDNYINRWGGHFSGESIMGGYIAHRGSMGSYWSQTELGLVAGRFWSFENIWGVAGLAGTTKSTGMVLRCVR